MARPKHLSPEALTILSSGVEITGKSLVITTGQLDRKLYVEVNAALEAIGGAWSRKLKAHTFTEDPRDALDQILIDGEFSDAKRDFDQFFTPPELAKIVVACAGVEGCSVLEPSAGHGALVIAARNAGAKSIRCIEQDPKCARALQETTGYAASVCDFISWSQSERSELFDRVVMNPPFSRQQDIAHVREAFGCLRRTGRLVAIMSAGVVFRQDRRAAEFRRFVESVGGLIEGLPEQSFKTSGTNVNTVLVTLERT